MGLLRTLHAITVPGRPHVAAFSRASLGQASRRSMTFWTTRHTFAELKFNFFWEQQIKCPRSSTNLSHSLSLSLERWSFKCTKSDATAKLCHALPSAVWSALEIIPRTCSVSGRPAGSGQNGLGIHVLQSRPCFSIHSICLPEHSFRLLLCYFSIPHHSCL